MTEIKTQAFLGTQLNTVVVRGTTPATLSGSGHFEKHDGLHIYVPAASVEAYKTAWSEYAQYIVRDAYYYGREMKRVRTTEAGQLAGKLRLTPVKESGKIRYLQGDNYTKYDSLTVIGPLNGDDVAVLRHLAGADAYDSDPTDGRLRYLNLWKATLCKDTDHSYNGYGVDEYLEKDNWVGEYMFHNCTALETLILPASVTEIGENAFQDATALKRIAVGRSTTKYTRDLLQNLEGLEELVFLTDQFASSESSDPWEADIDDVIITTGFWGYIYLQDNDMVNYGGLLSSDDEIFQFSMTSDGYITPSSHLADAPKITNMHYDATMNIITATADYKGKSLS